MASMVTNWKWTHGFYPKVYFQWTPTGERLNKVTLLAVVINVSPERPEVYILINVG